MFSESILRALAKEKLILGDNCNVKPRWVKRRSSLSRDNITNLRPVKFYPHFVLFETRSGFMETFTYWDIWNELLGGDTSDFDKGAVAND